MTFGIGSALILVGALWLSLIAAKPWDYWLGFGVLTAAGISFGTIVPRPRPSPGGFNAIAEGPWR